MDRLLELYKKSKGGHELLSEPEFVEYSELRKQEYLTRKGELIAEGKHNVQACKDDVGDIIGWTCEHEEAVLE